MNQGMLKVLKVVVAVFTVVIVILLGLLIFVNPAKGPSAPGVNETIQPATSPDGHVVVSAPLPDALVVSPVSISGAVTGGGWFFEASFPVKVLDGDGAVIGEGQARAQNNWMSTGTVPFSGSITFSVPKYANGTVVFAKDNPSGMPQNAEEFSVPVRFR